MADRWQTAAQGCAQMARELLAVDDVQSVLEEILGWAVRIVAGCEAAGVTTARRGGRVDTAAATGELARYSDLLQNKFREGPCHDALWKEDTFSTPDLSGEQRWPNYAPAATDVGIRSVLAFRLYTGEDTLGALDLYSTRVDAFDEVDHQIGLVVASHAAVAFRWTRTEEQLRQAIESRRIIGEAVGIVIERRRVTPEEAFAILSKESQDRNIRLRALAERVITTGHIPDRNACPEPDADVGL